MSLKLFFSALLLALALPAHAYKLSPMSQVFAPSGSGTVRSFELTNDSTEKVALDLSITTLERSLDYAETNVNADKDFLIYPSQILLAPGARQTVRVTWVGEPNLKKEVAYRLVVEELPVSKTKMSVKTSGEIRILMTFRATLYIRPAKATPKISLESATEKDKPGSLSITVQNNGTARGGLRRCGTKVTAGGKQVALPAESLRILEQGWILAGHKRRFFIPLPEGLPVGAMSVDLKCEVEH